MGVPVPQIQEGIVEVTQVIPQERISERIVEQIVDAPGGPECLDPVESDTLSCSSSHDRGLSRQCFPQLGAMVFLT